MKKAQKKKVIKTKTIKLTNEEIDELVNGLAWTYDQGREISSDIGMELTIKLKSLREQKHDCRKVC